MINMCDNGKTIPDIASNNPGAISHEFEYKYIVDNKTIGFTLIGSLDTLSAPKLQSAFESEQKNISSAVLDCERLDYISSAGLRVLLLMYNSCSGNLKLLGVNDSIKQILDVTGFSQVFLGED